MDLFLIQVAVGTPRVIGTNRQGEVTSGIAKHVTSLDQVVVRFHNIDGDGQADLRNHGGADKAVYCYPREHRAFWSDQLGYARDHAPFGENLSVRGLLEDDACIGDVWQWGDVRLQISQPRWPCFKLAMHSGHIDMVKRFVESERSGWYLRILQEGVAPTSGGIIVAERDELGITVKRAMQARRGVLSPEEADEVFSHPALASAWKH